MGFARVNAMEWADRNLKKLGDFDAFVSGDSTQRSLSASDSARRLATALLETGLAPSDRVLLWMPNGPDLAIAWRAVIRAGGITVVAHHDAPPKRIEEIAAETTPTVIISTNRGDATLQLSTIRHRILSRGDAPPPGWQSMSELIARHAPLREPVARMGSDVASIVHTSGTTGEPKGVVTRHEALTARMKKQRPPFARFRKTIRHLVALPMSTAFGSSAFNQGLAQKCTLYFLEEFDPARALKTIERYRIQQTYLVPAMCEAILALPDIGKYDVSSLRTVVCSGSAVSPELVARFRSALGVRLEVGYGMSGIGVVSRTRSRSTPGSAGRMTPGMNARVEDANGRPLPAGEVGELVLRIGDGAAIELWNGDSSVTSAAAPGSWYKTGDMVRFDSRGDLHVVGRGDDLIIQGGHNIHGPFVTDVVQRLEGVRECAVVGVPNDHLGQEAVVSVALDDNARLTASDILAHCKLHLDAGSVPASVWFVESLPRTELGKVKLHELRSTIRISRGMIRDTQFLGRLRAADGTARDKLLRTKVQRLAEDVLRTSISDGSASFRNMGLDSLGSVEFTHALSEAVGRPLPATITYTYPTIDALSAFVLDLLDLRPGGVAKSIGSRKQRAQAPRLCDFFSSRELDAARSLASGTRVTGDSRSILLTGANGFLGRFLVLEILDRFEQDGGELYCLVRAPDDSSALERMRNAYGSDPNLQAKFESLLASRRLTVLAGDFTKSRLGLDDDIYDRLSAQTDCIVHNGAVVDHVLGYDELYAPNVLGTVEVMRLALAVRVKRVSYVSTIAAREFSSAASVQRDGGIAAGYVACKWASERLLKELHDNAGVPVRLFRPGQILAHRVYHGQINPRDTLTRLVQGIVMTSLAPASFYEQHSMRTGHFDGLPVDVVAKSVAAASVSWRPGDGEYGEQTVVNDLAGVNLDIMTDWVRSAGYRIDHVDRYSDWHNEFANRLSSLNGSQRQHSLLPLVHAWERPIRSQESALRTSRDRDGTQEASPVNETFIHKCLADMRVLGLIGPVG